ncbi:MAG: DUF1565 domain-containing protein [Promicromonosporaceae bacterium]|nr:DUF1565 domain-containing protein [Promicromonosporaceae bacterium]
MAVIHVAVNGDDTAAGSPDSPLRTINAAAALARPGDTVRVQEGTYREWVRPVRGGLSDTRRITFEAAAGQRVIITGAEPVTGWIPEGEGVWRTVIPNRLFGEFNPFAEALWGDWLIPGTYGAEATRGDVYLDGRSLTQAASRAEVATSPERTEVIDGWTHTAQAFADPAWTRARWYAEVAEETTTVWANFLGADPNESLTEVNVRPAVFFPTLHRLDWITVRGFELAQAATPWTPPTADQMGLVGPNWAKGWVIEDNVIRDSKCSGVSLGKERSTGHNQATERGRQPGYAHQIEVVFSALEIGWSKDTIGSHVVRNNQIFDCGQNGIVGHLGAVFSRIEGNHIHHIGTKREFYGFEIAGIKLHAAIDVQIIGNRIDHCTLGTWLDWQTQGTRLARNIFFHNTRDFFVEVSHGPYLVDHNIFASPVAIENFAQGGAYAHNLVGGVVRVGQVLDRSTPYHRPHSTAVAGFTVVFGGDDRWVGNLFTGADVEGALLPGAIWLEAAPSASGTSGYDAYPATWTEYFEQVNADQGDHERFNGKRQAVTISDNAYAGGTRPYAAETGAQVLGGTAGFDLIEAETPERALEIAARHPMARAGLVEVLPFYQW